MKGGCVKILCGHAHSADPELQTMSLWALKHLVSAAPRDLKVSCMEELGVGWLIQTMTGDQRDPSMSRSSQPLAMGTANAAGEQVDLLNATDEPAMEVDESSSEDDVEDDEESVKVSPFLPNYLPHGAGSSASNAQHRTRLRLLKQEEQNPAVIAWRHDIRIQEQALDFIRNLIGDPQASQHEMIDHIFNALQIDRLFDILLAKLRLGSPPNQPQREKLPSNRDLPRPPNFRFPPGYQRLQSGNSNASAHTAFPPTATGTSPSDPTANFPAPSGVLISTLYILVHIANGSSQQRRLLLSRAALVQATLPLFSHPDREVRLACLWLTQNLLWLDSKSAEDQASARQRARELRALGVEERVREALRDEDLDIHQRAKGVVESLDRYLGEGQGIGAVGEGPVGGSQRSSRDGGLMSGRTVGVGLGGSGSGGPARGWESRER